MRNIKVKVYPSKAKLKKEDQLAWKIAEIASDNAPLHADAVDMVINRIIDNAAVAIASLQRKPVSSARDMALAHPREHGATVFGINSDQRFHCEWAAWANGTAVRELDFHDTFLAADYSHPGDNIPPILAVAQQKNLSGIDLNTETIYQSIQQALHTTISTRQSRKGQISSWKAFAPSHAGKLAIEAVDRAMRGEGSPSPIYEGEDSVIAYVLSGPKEKYTVPLPKINEEKKAILETYTKEHSAEYQAQAWIDLARSLNKKINNISNIKKIEIHTSHHTHNVIGTGANDPQKMDPNASRETLDHSIMYIFAVALEDGNWHHINSYTPQRANKKSTVDLWKKIKTFEDKKWTKKYHDPNPKKKCFGGRVIIKMKDGSKIEDQLGIADAHPNGKRPFKRQNYINKFKTLTANIIDQKESERFLEDVQNLKEINKSELHKLNVEVVSDLQKQKTSSNSIF